MNISRIVNSFGTLSLINFAGKHAARCRHSSKPEVAARDAVVSRAAGELELAYAARRPLRSLWSAATRLKLEADDALDRFLAGMSYDLLAPSMLNGNRKHPDYRALFTEGNLAFLDLPERIELVHVGAILQHLETHAEHPLAGRAGGLKERSLVLEASLDPQAAAEAAYRAALKTEKEKREQLCRTLRKSVTVLRDAFDGDEDAVEALFPTVAEARVKEDEEEEPKVE